MKKNILKILLIIILVILFIFVLFMGFVINKFYKVNKEEINIYDIGINKENENKLTGFRNIVFLGVDSRDRNGYRKGNRSDCIVIASVNYDTKEVKLNSVYRDTYLRIDGVGLDKITHAYSYGTEELTLKALNENLDLNIKEYVTVNFDAVVEAVDLLGGVDIYIESIEEMNYLNNYIAETSRVTGKNSKKLTSIGKQTLDGVQAVSYCRVRYTSGGDYKRTERMRNVIIAMVSKLKGKNLIEINNFLDKLLPKIHTNISLTEIIPLIPSLMDLNISYSSGWPYETKGKNMGRYYGIPVTLESNVIKLHNNLFGDTDYVPSDKVKEISNEIIRRTGYNLN